MLHRSGERPSTGHGLYRDDPVDWAVSRRLVDYAAAVRVMEARAEAVARGTAPELVWLIEHPPLYTAGTSAREDELLAPRFPVHRAGRGGRFTYHGPGQRVVYLMLDLHRRGGDVRAFVSGLEEWVIDALAELGVAGERRERRIGIWVRGADGDEKIAALGLRVRKGVSLHGLSLNVSPDLSHYDGILACGLAGYGATSLAKLGRTTSMEVVDNALRARFEGRFGPTLVAPAPCAEVEAPAA